MVSFFGTAELADPSVPIANEEIRAPLLPRIVSVPFLVGRGENEHTAHSLKFKGTPSVLFHFGRAPVARGDDRARGIMFRGGPGTIDGKI